MTNAAYLKEWHQQTQYRPKAVQHGFERRTKHHAEQLPQESAPPCEHQSQRSLQRPQHFPTSLQWRPATKKKHIHGLFLVSLQLLTLGIKCRHVQAMGEVKADMDTEDMNYADSGEGICRSAVEQRGPYPSTEMTGSRAARSRAQAWPSQRSSCTKSWLLPKR